MTLLALPQIAQFDVTYEYIAYSLALLVGITLGLVGAGGSILTLPILVYVAGLEPKKATTYSLFVVGLSALIGAANYLKKGLLHIKTVAVFFIPSFIAVLAMKRLILPHIPDEIYEFESFMLNKDMLIMFLFSIVMLAASFSMIRKNNLNSNDDFDVKDIVFNYKAISLQGLIVGSLTGLVGAGGGFLIVPALTMFAKLPIRLTIGTSLLIVAINSLSGFFIDYANHEFTIDWNFLYAFSSMAFAGIFIGTFLSNFIKANHLKKLFGYFVLTMALYLLARQIFGVIIT